MLRTAVHHSPRFDGLHILGWGVDWAGADGSTDREVSATSAGNEIQDE